MKDLTLKPIQHFSELSKAFKLINREILLEEIKLYGIRSVAAELFESYFENRFQRVHILRSDNKFNSDSKHPCWVFVRLYI